MENIDKTQKAISDLFKIAIIAIKDIKDVKEIVAELKDLDAVEVVQIASQLIINEIPALIEALKKPEEPKV